MTHTSSTSPFPASSTLQFAVQEDDPLDLVHIVGQEHVKRALEVAATGGHNILLWGAPGGGKTLLARALVTLLPPLLEEEVQDLRARFAAYRRELPTAPASGQRLFLLPAPIIEPIHLLGDGAQEPGGLLYAQHGTICFDRLDCFAPGLLARLEAMLDRPECASVQFIATMQPCACGFYGDPIRECTCTAGSIVRYQQRVALVAQRAPINVAYLLITWGTHTCTTRLHENGL